MLSAADPHSHVVSPLKYPYFSLCSLLQVYRVPSLFRHLQLSQGVSCPVARSSYKYMCLLQSSLPFVDSDNFGWEVNWLNTCKEASSRLLTATCWCRPKQGVGLSLYLLGSFHSCTYTSSDFRRGHTREQIQIIYICWL